MGETYRRKLTSRRHILRHYRKFFGTSVAKTSIWTPVPCPPPPVWSYVQFPFTGAPKDIIIPPILITAPPSLIGASSAVWTRTDEPDC